LFSEWRIEVKNLKIFLALIAVVATAVPNDGNASSPSRSEFYRAIVAKDFSTAKGIFAADIRGALTGLEKADFQLVFKSPEVKDPDFEFALVLAANFLYPFNYELESEPIFEKYRLDQMVNCTNRMLESYTDACQYFETLKNGFGKGQLNYRGTVYGTFAVGNTKPGKTLPMTLAHLGYALSLKTILAAKPDLSLTDMWQQGVLTYISNSTDLKPAAKVELGTAAIQLTPTDLLSPEFFQLVYYRHYRMAGQIAMMTQVIPSPPGTRCNAHFEQPLDYVINRDHDRVDWSVRIQDPEYIHLVETLVSAGYRMTIEELTSAIQYNHYQLGYSSKPILSLPIFNALIKANPNLLYSVKTAGWEFMRGNTLLHDLAASDAQTPNRIEFVRAVVARGLDIDTPNVVTGETAIFLAQDIGMVKALVELGSSLKITNKKRLNAVQAARRAARECGVGDYCTTLKTKAEYLKAVQSRF
jgi:hypothetical protein